MISSVFLRLKAISVTITFIYQIICHPKLSKCQAALDFLAGSSSCMAGRWGGILWHSNGRSREIPKIQVTTLQWVKKPVGIDWDWSWFYLNAL